jgi:hypothetical protein
VRNTNYIYVEGGGGGLFTLIMSMVLARADQGGGSAGTRYGADLATPHAKGEGGDGLGIRGEGLGVGRLGKGMAWPALTGYRADLAAPHPGRGEGVGHPPPPHPIYCTVGNNGLKRFDRSYCI